MICGIYKIVNKKNGMFYLGGSKNIKKRWSQHKCDLSKNKHHSTHLQRAWNKYGINSFIFEIIETTTEEDLIEKEQYYLDSLKPWKNNIGYNLSKNSSGGDLLSCHPDKNKILRKIKKSMIKHIRNLTEEQKKEKWSKPKEKNPNWKGGVSKITFICPICGKQTNNRKKQTKTCRQCMSRKGRKNSFFGKKHTKKSIEKLRKLALARGNYLNSQKIKVKINGKVCSSFSSAARDLNCCHTTIRNRLKQPEKYPNYKII
jgi:group I intron endonuclease